MPKLPSSKAIIAVLLAHGFEKGVKKAVITNTVKAIALLLSLVLKKKFQSALYNPLSSKLG